MDIVSVSRTHAGQRCLRKRRPRLSIEWEQRFIAIVVVSTSLSQSNTQQVQCLFFLPESTYTSCETHPSPPCAGIASCCRSRSSGAGSKTLSLLILSRTWSEVIVIDNISNDSQWFHDVIRNWIRCKFLLEAVLCVRVQTYLRGLEVQIFTNEWSKVMKLNRLWMFDSWTWLKKFRQLGSSKLTKVDARWVLLTQKSKLNHESIRSTTWKLRNLDAKFLNGHP